MQRHETHISEVQVGERRAWKRKKPLRFDFADFTALAAREAASREEVRVNRRFAPRLYLGVAPLHRRSDGTLALGLLDPMGGEAPPPAPDADAPWPAARADDGPIEDWCVVMRRLDDEGMLDRLVARGAFTHEQAFGLARRLAAFHGAQRAAAGTRLAATAAPDALAARAGALLDQARAAAAAAPALAAGPPLLPPPLAAALRDASTRFLREQRDLLARRAASGAVVDGHGDLHCANVGRFEGELVPYDAIEFDPALRVGDVASDLAFLTMDLRRRGAGERADDVLAAYAKAAGDRDLERVVPWYESQRATVRGIVAALRAAQLAADLRDAALCEARGAFAFAATSGWRTPLIALCGLPGTGKSRLARALAPRLRAGVLCADVLRKQLAGLAPDAPAPAERKAALYAPDAVARVYDELLARARPLLAAGRAVILDATWPGAAQRAAASAAARRAGVPFLVVHLHAAPSEVEARLARRVLERGEPSDADVAVYRAARERFEPPDELPAVQRADFASRDGALDDPRDAVLAGPLGGLFAAIVHHCVAQAGAAADGSA